MEAIWQDERHGPDKEWMLVPLAHCGRRGSWLVTLDVVASIDILIRTLYGISLIIQDTSPIRANSWSEFSFSMLVC